MVITESAPAKINLFLHVIGKKQDYHQLDMLIVFADSGDRLHFETADTLSLSLSGPFAEDLVGETDNLVLRAAKALQKETGCMQGAAITLEKHLPVAAGLGGGSSDAAATLLGLNRLWELDLPLETLGSLAAHLGSDVPMCLFRQALYAQGRGEVITFVKQCPPLYGVLVNPLQPLSTGTVFQRVTPPYDEPLEEYPLHFASDQKLCAFLFGTHNALEQPAKALMPSIAPLLQRILLTDGCMLARMSGAGATCFGLYGSAEATEEASTILTEHFPDYWVHACRLG